MSKYYLSDIADFISDKIEFSSIELDKYISTDNMLPNFNGVTLSTVEPSLNKCTKFKAGDTLFSNIRTYFKKVWFADFDGGCSPDVIVMRTKNEELVLPEFLYLLICSEDFINFTVMSSNGAKMPRGDKKAMLKYEFEIPSIEEQKIAINHYFKIKEKIQLNTQINQTLEQIAQALFKSWFVDFDPEELTALSQTQPDRYAELAETAKAFPYEIVEVDGVEVPKGWEVKRIDEVIQKIPVDKKYSSKTAFSEGLVPILDQGRSGVIGYHNNKPGVKASIEDPIIVFANHTCYMRLISYDFSAIQNVFAFKGKECNLYWLYLATLGKQEFVEYKGHFPDFLIKEIVVPPEELTALFGKYVKESFSKIFINDRENSNLAKIRDLLLPKLLNGEFIR